MAKSFKQDLAENIGNHTAETAADYYISAQQETLPEALGQPPLKAPKGYRVDPRFIELKSKRVQLMCQPSVIAKLQAKAKKERLSFNEYVNKIFRAAANED